MKQEYIDRGLDDYVEAAKDEVIGIETALGIAKRGKQLSGA